MARPPLPLGTWGTISTQQVTPGVHRARARYRDYDGHTRQVEARGKTAAAARRELQARMANRVTPRGSGLSLDSRMQDLTDQYFADARVAGQPSERSLEKYEATWRVHLAPVVGQLRIREATPSLLNAVIAKIHENRPGTSPLALSLLRQIMAVAVRLDVVVANPADGVSPPKGREKKKIRALTLDELAELRSNIAAWQSASKGRPDYLLDLVDVMLGTGVRISDLCALKWSNVDFESGRLILDAHIVRENGTWIVAEGSKSSKGHRELVLPRFALQTLLARRASVTGEWVFPNSRGTGYAFPKTVTRQWAEARGEKFAWAGTHALRKTVATVTAAQADAESAARQLGHANSSVTRRHYIQKVTEAPDLTSILDVFAHQQE